MFTPKRGFASDNNATVHPKILSAIIKANQGHAIAYGDDPWTQHASKVFARQFGPRAKTYLVFNGTAANVLCLASMLPTYGATICAAGAHINVDECGAPERFSGKLLPCVTPNGKLTPRLVQEQLKGIGDQQHVQPRVISITQSTELGTVYRIDEIKALSRFAKKNRLLLHMDGARICNAAASLGVSLRELTLECGVDALSFGGTKNGLLLGEAVVFFRPELAYEFEFRRKQGMQLVSKMRFLAAQFDAFFEKDLWRKNAQHANRMASLLAREIKKIPEVKVTQAVEVNAVFAQIPRRAIVPLQKYRNFYVWDEDRNEVRWMTSHDTTRADILEFVGQLKRILR